MYKYYVYDCREGTKDLVIECKSLKIAKDFKKEYMRFTNCEERYIIIQKKLLTNNYKYDII